MIVVLPELQKIRRILPIAILVAASKVSINEVIGIGITATQFIKIPHQQRDRHEPENRWPDTY